MRRKFKNQSACTIETVSMGRALHGKQAQVKKINCNLHQNTYTAVTIQRAHVQFVRICSARLPAETPSFVAQSAASNGVVS